MSAFYRYIFYMASQIYLKCCNAQSVKLKGDVAMDLIRKKICPYPVPCETSCQFRYATTHSRLSAVLASVWGIHQHVQALRMHHLKGIGIYLRLKYKLRIKRTIAKRLPKGKSNKIFWLRFFFIEQLLISLDIRLEAILNLAKYLQR